jgi:hypothetical protein
LRLDVLCNAGSLIISSPSNLRSASERNLGVGAGDPEATVIRRRMKRLRRICVEGWGGSVNLDVFKHQMRAIPYFYNRVGMFSPGEGFPSERKFSGSSPLQTREIPLSDRNPQTIADT